MALSKAQREAREDDRALAIANLVNDLGSEHVTRDRNGRPIVHTLVTHVSRSGMTRHMRLFMVYAGQICEITTRAARALGWRTKDGRLIVNGVGMDMGFHAVYSLACALNLPDPANPEGNRGYGITQQWL
jgi:hypothetical protein